MNTSGTGASSGRRFELIRTLGVGSFGSVYLAEMEGAGGFRRRVALKLLNASWDQVSDASTRLRDEARLLGRLQHKHIVRVDDLVRLDGRWALVMEFVDGVDLEAVVAPNPAAGDLPPMPPRAALEVMAAVASALQAASDSPAGDGRPLAVVHRDIKPSNVRLSAAGDIKVLDFGVARADFAEREAKTERVRYGSVGYMAPERLLGGEEASSGDVYSLGVMFYELVMQSTYGRSELAEPKQLVQVAAARDAVAARAGEEAADLFASCLQYEAELRPSAAQVYGSARGLAAARAEPDLGAWAARVVPALIGAQTEDTACRGRVLAESDSGGRAIVNGGTLVLPAELADPPMAANGSNSSTITLPVDPEEPPVVGRPLKMAWIAGGITGFGVVLGLTYAVFGPSPTPPAEKPSAPVAAVAAPASPPPGPEAAPVPPESAAPAAPEAAVAPQAAPTAPAPTAPTPIAAPKPEAKPKADAKPKPEATPVAPEPAPPDAAPAERLRSAKFVLVDSTERLDVVCGDVRANGSGNALVNNFPAGSCKVSASGSSTTVSVQEPRKVSCTLDAGSLACR